MADLTVRTRGLRELNRDLGKANRKLQREFQREIREKIAEPVAEDVRRRAAGKGWSPTTVRMIRAGSRHGGAVVQQRARKTTGKRPDYGSLQMREAFIPALEDNEQETIARFEDFLERITSESGLEMGGVL